MSAPTGKLILLLPSVPYTLAYTLPLLLLSTLLVFSGTFLTLDRTRSFPPRQGADYSAVPGLFELKPKKRRFSWHLEGGIGGIAIGYTFGVHLSTLLALLIPSTTPSAPLSQNSFLAVWILSCVPMAVLSGRYRLVSRILAGLSGGTTIAVGLSVILHPSLLTRLILLGIFGVLSLSLVVASSAIPRLTHSLLHSVMRCCVSATGAFGLVLSVALLSNPQVEAWANVWERLWVANGESWGTGKEQGLSAAFGILWIIGMIADWGLGRYFGECPDEKWDDYLTKYVSDLPNHKDRAGTFQPHTSLWDRMFSAQTKDYDLFKNVESRRKGADIVFPSDKDMGSKAPGPFNIQPFSVPPPLHRQSSIEKVRDAELAIDEIESVPLAANILKKKVTKPKQSTGRRKPLKFGAADSSDEEEEWFSSKSSPPLKSVKAKRPFVITNHHPSYSSSTPTLVDDRRQQSGSTGEEKERKSGRRAEEAIPEVDVGKVDYDRELEELKRMRGERFDDADYSDGEGVGKGDSPGTPLPLYTPSQGAPWVPAFMWRHRQDGGEDNDLLAPPRPVAGALPVPATPSLIRAVDRIQAAQREVYGNIPRGHDGFPGYVGEADVVDNVFLEEGVEMRTQGKREPRWEEFWRDVQTKASVPRQS
ncbi:hypothetical protein FA15DRAFT_670531 [Coprinopsis marcescibilis]|uniref:DUF4203 domain-containing protein n=1 Tax=Coprinopsis marcescibilis TaxID=230819 RepID=A0A5C3KSC6_COPMA|nr:hypothetical protein FA15DRAFT_670531 [Coprinopsis marcescibilis]